MKRFFYVRFCCFIALMLLSSSAYAGHTFSFVVGRHRVRIEAPRHCHSPSCLSVSIPEIRETLDRYDNFDAAPAAAATAKPLAPAPEAVSPRPTVAPAAKSSIDPVASVAAPTPRVELAAAATRDVAAPAASNIQPSRPQTTTPTPPSTQPPTDAARPASDTVARISRIVREVDDAAAETPLGDWQTEGKGSVRIERCGRALCGHVLNPSSNDNGEMVLINMKPKTAALWSGRIYSRDSANTYYATIAMKGPHSLRVEACALGRFFCSGNLWSRIGGKPEKPVISRQPSPEPRS
ncbi:MAG TPA: DUF2147 domain-containing protein [Bradyrhizobium sp.]